MENALVLGHFADATLYIVVASVLSVFDVRPDPESGPFCYSYTGSLARYAHYFVSEHQWEADSRSLSSRPNTFPCLFTPRDKITEEPIIADSMAR